LAIPAVAPDSDERAWSLGSAPSGARPLIVATNPTSPPPDPRTSFASDGDDASIVLTSAGAAVEPMTTTRFAGGASRIAWRSPPSATTSP
jgi:hypothetical protein